MAFSRVLPALIALAFTLTCSSAQVALTEAQALKIGKRIWQNECAGTVSGLTSWNSGEDFPSLGIGHFIWYPAGKRGPFEESFPALIQFLKNDASAPAMPAWLAGNPSQPCPWPDRAAFTRDLQGPKLTQLRQYLAATVGQQAHFAALRLEEALPKMQAGLSSAEQQKLAQNFRAVATTPTGVYALVDYVNFKGEGVKETERYNGEGWGLRQVLLAIKGSPTGTAATNAFADAAASVLKKRVANSPPARGEAKWLPGWINRTNTYRAG